MSFLPETYVVSSGSGGDYTKLQAGKNLLRVLSKQPVIGFEYWNNDNKPVRCAENPGKNPADMRTVAPNGGDERVKEFWAMVVYNYHSQKIEIWQVTQVGIKAAIQDLSRNAKWGAPSKYDLSITRKGSGLSTEYSVVANPPTPIDPAIMAVARETPINLRALLDGGNPFEAAPDAAPAPAPKTAAPAPKPTAPKAAVAKPAPALVAAGDDEPAPGDDDDLPF